MEQVQQGAPELPTFEEYMEVLNAIGISNTVETEEIFKKHEDDLEGLFNYLLKEFEGEFAAGQLAVQSIANFTFGAFSLDEPSRQVLRELYAKPIETTEEDFLTLEHSGMYSHWVSHNICNVVVVASEDENNDKLIFGCGGPATIILKILNYVEGTK